MGEDRMSESDRKTYILRGWIAFVAFVDFALALRSFVDLTTFLGTQLQNSNVPMTASRSVAFLHLHSGLTMVSCAFGIHSFPLTIVTALSVILKVSYWLMEALLWKTTSLSFHLIFPTVINAVSLYGLFVIQPHLRVTVTGEELIENALKKKSHQRPLLQRSDHVQKTKMSDFPDMVEV